MNDKLDLGDVLDTLDRWVEQQFGLQHMQFTYETKGGVRVVIQIGRRKDKEVEPSGAGEKP